MIKGSELFNTKSVSSQSGKPDVVSHMMFCINDRLCFPVCWGCGLLQWLVSVCCVAGVLLQWLVCVDCSCRLWENIIFKS